MPGPQASSALQRHLTAQLLAIHTQKLTGELVPPLQAASPPVPTWRGGETVWETVLLHLANVCCRSVAPLL